MRLQDAKLSPLAPRLRDRCRYVPSVAQTLISEISSVEGDAPRRERTRVVGAVAAWLAAIALGASVASALSGHAISINAPPLHARADPVLPPELALALVVSALLVGVLPALATRASWRVLLAGAPASAVVFGCVLASIRGADRVVAPVRGHREYLAVLPRVADVGTFLGTFTERLPSYPVHVQGHPPGPVLLAVALRDLGLGAPVWFAAALIAGGVLLVPATLIVVREVAGEHWARRAMPFLVVGPAAIWLVTSADALFAGIGALGVALVVVATGTRSPRRDLLAVTGGLVLGAAAFLSYGLVLLAVIPLAIAWRRRTVRPIALAAAGALAVALAFLGAGFWWVDGMAATREQYFAGIAARRPYLAFALINVAAFALVVGPAAAVGIARLRDRRMWLIVGAGLVVVGAGLVSGLAKGEVERIWLPFVPWVLVAAAATRRRVLVGWLGAQAGLAILIESLIRTPW